MLMQNRYMNPSHISGLFFLFFLKSLLAVKYEAEPLMPKSCTCSKDTSWDKRSLLVAA